MSHVSKIEMEIQSLHDLKLACKDMGLTFVKNQKTYAWYGRWVGDYPLPEGKTVEDLGKCDHAIQVPGCEYEIGVIKKPEGGYELVWDFWRSGGLENVLGKDAGKLKQAYAKVKVFKEARLNGYQVSHIRTDTGIRLTLTA